MTFALDDVGKDYWGNRLEVNTELVLQRQADHVHFMRWVDRLPQRPRVLAAQHLGVAADLGVKKTREALLEHKDDLVAMMLVEAATAGKRTYAINEVAKARLSAEAVEQCWVSGEKYDRLALMWLLYIDDPANLELVFRLHQVQKKGFARMVLDKALAPPTTKVWDLLTPKSLQVILDAYEEEKRSLRQSHCAAVLTDGGNFQVFVKRDLRPSFVAHGRDNVFGWDPEWIVLDFEPDLRRVYICSVSPDVPLHLANRIATAYFGEKVWYDNESLYSSGDHVRAFVESLMQEPERLPLVEVTVANSPLDGGVQLRIKDPGKQSVAPAILHLQALAGTNPLGELSDIESMKVHKFKKLVKLILEPSESTDEVVVRYSDQPLSGKERREFEQLMEHEYAITVLSTEKRYAT